MRAGGVGSSSSAPPNVRSVRPGAVLMMKSGSIGASGLRPASLTRSYRPVTSAPELATTQPQSAFAGPPRNESGTKKRTARPRISTTSGKKTDSATCRETSLLISAFCSEVSFPVSLFVSRASFRSTSA